MLRRTPQLTIYQVKKFEDDICEIPISLERWCRNSGSMEKLKEATVIDGRTAEVLTPPEPVEPKKAKQALKNKKSNRQQVKPPSKQSKKEQVFSLLDEGHDVNSPQVKPLASYKLRHKYYTAWKKERK